MKNEVEYVYTTLDSSNQIKIQPKHEKKTFVPFLLGFVVGMFCFYLIMKYGRENI
jgi:hypothetical protein